MVYLVSTRFNDETWDQNKRYRKKHGLKCIYGSPLEFTKRICVDSNVFVLEMNNSTNKLEGIGLIKNKPETTRYYKVHQDGNTNRYIYIGNYFLDDKTIQEYDNHLVSILEEILLLPVPENFGNSVPSNGGMNRGHF